MPPCSNGLSGRRGPPSIGLASSPSLGERGRPSSRLLRTGWPANSFSSSEPVACPSPACARCSRIGCPVSARRRTSTAPSPSPNGSASPMKSEARHCASSSSWVTVSLRRGDDGFGSRRSRRWLVAELGLAEKVVRLHETLDQAGIPHAFGGALALAYYAEPRVTVDIDVNLFVDPSSYSDVLGVLLPLGLDRPPADDAVLRDGQGRLWWGRNPVDLFFAYHPLHDALSARIRRVPLRDDEIPT